MNYLTNIQVLEYTKYYRTIFSIRIINGVQLSEIKRHEFNKIKLN